MILDILQETGWLGRCWYEVEIVEQNSGPPLMHYAANRHDLKMLKVLLDSNANINAQNNVSPVSPA